MTTKSQIKATLLQPDARISITSTTTVGGAVVFMVDYGIVRCIGWANEVERSISTIDEVVDYLYAHRARIIKE